MGTPHSDPAVSRRAAVAGLGAIGLGLALASRGALAQDATPTGPTNEQVLAEVTLPANVLAFETATVVGVTTYDIPAGTSVTVTGTGDGCCPAQNLTYVIDGTSTFRDAVPTYLLRAGNGTTPEVVAAETEVSLGPGDAILYRDEFDWEWTVSDDGPTRLVSFWMIEGSGLPSSDLASWGYVDFEFFTTDALPSEPLTLRFRELTLDAGATLSPGAAVIQLAVGSTTESPRLSTRGDYSVKNIGTEPVGLYVASLSPADPNAEIIVAGVAATPVATPTS